VLSRHGRVFEQVLFAVGDESIQLLFAVIDSLQHRANCQQFKGAAHWKALVRPIFNSLVVFCIDGTDSNSTAAFVFDGTNLLGSLAGTGLRRDRNKCERANVDQS